MEWSLKRGGGGSEEAAYKLLSFPHSGQTHPGGDSLLCELPQSVQEDVCMKGYDTLLTSMPIFSNVDPAFLRQLSVGLSLYLFAPGDIIIYERDMGRDMYLIRKGYVEVMGSVVGLGAGKEGRWEGERGKVGGDRGKRGGGRGKMVE